MGIRDNLNYRKVDLETGWEDYSYAIRKYHFFTWWKKYNASHNKCLQVGNTRNGEKEIRELFEIVNKCRMFVGIEPYTLDKFLEGIQYRKVRHRNYMTAREEMLNLVWGYW